MPAKSLLLPHCSSWLDIFRTNARYRCAVSRVLVPELHWGRLWTVLEIRDVGENCRASTLSSRFLFYFELGLGKFLGTGEEEEFRSDNREEDNIDGTGKVEHRVTEVKDCRLSHNWLPLLASSWNGVIKWRWSMYSSVVTCFTFSHSMSCPVSKGHDLKLLYLKRSYQGFVCI